MNPFMVDMVTATALLLNQFRLHAAQALGQRCVLVSVNDLLLPGLVDLKAKVVSPLRLYHPHGRTEMPNGVAWIGGGGADGTDVRLYGSVGGIPMDYRPPPGAGNQTMMFDI